MVVVSGRAAPGARRVDRPRLYGRAALLALAVGFAVTVLAGSGSQTSSGRLGGDFPAFYAAGQLVAEGSWDTLYDPDAQARAQVALFDGGGSVAGSLDDADGGGDYLYFAYPPPVAALYRPLAALDYRVAYVVHTLVMGALLVAALALARPLVPLLRRRFEAVVTAALLFYPMLRAVTGGQNTALTLLLLVTVWRSLEDATVLGGLARTGVDPGDGAARGEVVAGLAIAALLYKPQFALPLIGLMLWQRRWRSVGAAVAGGVALWTVSASVMGPGWLGQWWDQVGEFAALDAKVNAHNAISFLGVAEAALGAGSLASKLVAAPFVVATVASLLWLWRPTAVTDRAARFAATVVGLIVISPHAMFYDGGLLVLVGVVVADRLGRGGSVFTRRAGGSSSTGAAPPLTRSPAIPLALLVGCWAVAWLQLGAEALGVAPLFAVTLVACVAAGRLVAPHPLAGGSSPAMRSARI